METLSPVLSFRRAGNLGEHNTTFLKPFAASLCFFLCRARDGLHSQHPLVGSRSFVVLTRSPRNHQWHSWSKGWWPPVSEPSKPRVQQRWQRGTSPGQPRRSESSGTKLGREVAERPRVCGVSGTSAALKGAERSAKERPLAIQVEECQAFIHRTALLLGGGRTREQQELDAAVGPMAKFQEEMVKSLGG